ncbi:hypothetical protein Tco_1037757 [Tanacetum coccineum]
MSNLKFAETHNLVAFLEKPEESDGFEGIIDFLNAIQIQALVDGKKVIITEMSVRRALQLKDAEGTECLPNATIFAELERMGAKTTAWNEFSSTMASAIILFLDKQVKGMTKHKEIYVIPSHSKKVFANMKREGKCFSGRVTPLFQTIMVQAPEEPQKKQPRRKQRKDTEVLQPSGSTEPITHEAAKKSIVLDLENTKTSQAEEIAKLKERVKKLERRNKSRILGLKRLRKVGRSAQVVSFEDEGLGAQEDASKQGRKITDLDVDAEVTLVDKAQGRNSDDLMFDIGVFDEHEVEVEKVVSTAEVTTATATTKTVDELTLAQTLIEIKAAKPKAVTTAATTTTTAVTRPKARGVVVQEPSEFTTTTSQPSQLPEAKDKGKGKMVVPEKPLKKKDQILVDEEIAQRLQEELQAELEEEERLARQKEEEDNLIS